MGSTPSKADQQSEQLASGYLFQDAYTGRLWPRIEKHLNILEPVDPTTMYPGIPADRKQVALSNHSSQRQHSTAIAA